MARFGRAMSQTRGKSKEHIQSYLGRVFADRQFESGRISDPTVKESRSKALADLAMNDRFIWELPVYRKNENGKIERNANGARIAEKNARNPFSGPYVRMLYGTYFLTTPQSCGSCPESHLRHVAFTVTLQFNLCSNIKGKFASGTYRPKYQSYLNKIQARIKAKKFDLEDLFKSVEGGMESVNIILDDDEMANW